MAEFSTNAGRHKGRKQKYETGIASKKQIYACGGEFSHLETIENKTYEVYRLANGQIFKTASTPTREELKKSNSLAFFPSKAERERRKAYREQLEKERAEKAKLVEEIKEPHTVVEEPSKTPNER